MKIVTNIAAIIGLISTCVGLLITIIKPLRIFVINSIGEKSERKHLIEDIKTIKDRQETMISNDAKMEKRISKLEDRVLDNELSRLKSNLFDCGNRCRRGIHLYAEDMEHIRDVYTKYHDILHGNGAGTLEFEYIVDYYNHQDFSKEK